MPTISFENDLKELFTDLHRAKIFPDGKDIYDAVLKSSPEHVLSRYRQQKDSDGFDLLAFFHAHFEKAPQRESHYKSDTSLPVTVHIERLWEVLTRQPDATDNYSSLIRLPHPYVVPGGRFNEIYYWDSYFTMLGLRVSGKTDMIENMIANFAWLIGQYGFIPNGNRSYFLGRSQPPFFALMISLLAEEKGELVFIKYLPSLEKEYQFWMDGSNQLSSVPGNAIKRVVGYSEGKTLNRYFDNFPFPRTEMYTDDIELIEQHGGQADKMLLNIRAACESGWDFSSRWCSVPDDLATIHTTDILPVDLNCLLYFLEKTIAKAHGLNGDMERNGHYQSLADERKARINEVFWNDETSFYLDYDFVKKAQTGALSLAGVFPLFFNIADAAQARHCAKMISAKFLHDGGLATTTFESGQQWDAPNGWAPLQWIAVQGLRNYGFDTLAETIKERWVNLNTKVYKNTGKLLEKYNVVNTNIKSGGGEYPVQDGFGWTNGVLREMLKLRN